MSVPRELIGIFKKILITGMLLLILPIPFKSEILPGFMKSIYAIEQVKWINTPGWAPEVKIFINAPASEKFNPKHKVLLVLYATPNGNTIEQTIGNTDSVNTDWYYNIQHIGAQTRWLRENFKNTNLVVCYLESSQKSWGLWRKNHPDQQIRTMVDSIRHIFKKYHTSVVLNGHSGGGNFVFGFINSYRAIPSFIERIAFLDSNYGYDENLGHGIKLADWLKASKTNNLCIIAYNDSIALYQGKPFVSPTGGTWYRSKLMADYFKTQFKIREIKNADFIRYRALNRQLQILLKTNPGREIFHTILVERNGFIHSLLSGTIDEEKNYHFYPGDWAQKTYKHHIQKGVTLAGSQFPARPEKPLKGSEFLKLIDSIPWQQREKMVLNQLKSGNIPDFLRNFKKLRIVSGKDTLFLEVLPDYLAIGDNQDFYRMPMTPQTAQAFADEVGCMLPTSLIVDTIWKYAEYKLLPVTYKPREHDNEQIWMFARHNTAIDEQLAKLGNQYQREKHMLSGLKKDVVICNRLSILPDKVAIYGWHRPDGTFWQPLYTGHVNWYVDYSHGIRLVNRLAWLNGRPVYLDELLKDPILFKIVSNENGPMEQTRYVYQVSQ
jgi:hypothetical protein